MSGGRDAPSTGPLTKKQASSAADAGGCTAGTELAAGHVAAAAAAATAFGSRVLSPEQDVFEHNAWDHVEPDDAYLEYAEQQIRLHREHPVPPEEREQYNATPAAYWDNFYEANKDRFFKDRRWLHIEFPELFAWTDARRSARPDGADAGATVPGSAAKPPVASDARFRIMEVGCGAGNAVFPLLADIDDPRLFVHACDYSKAAVDVVKSSAAYDPRRCAASVWDLSSAELPAGIEAGSIDIMLMIFVFSALHPSQWRQAVDNAHRLLKPGGILLFRDYGRNDLTQLRFKKSRLLDDNLYVRGDGTRVYFFTNDELAAIFGGHFAVEQNAVDRRLLVNRKRELKMYRVWLQAKFRKSIAGP